MNEPAQVGQNQSMQETPLSLRDLGSPDLRVSSEQKKDWAMWLLCILDFICGCAGFVWSEERSLAQNIFRLIAAILILPLIVIGLITFLLKFY
jgi:hypothetical protein